MATKTKQQPYKFDVELIHKLLVRVKEELRNPQHEFENPDDVYGEVMDKLIKNQRKYKKLIGIQISKKKVEFIVHENNICVDYIKQDVVEDHIISKCKETERFNNGIKNMKKSNEDIMFLSVHLNEYRFATWDEFAGQIQEWAEKLDDVKLLDENIRVWKWGKQKYYRITFTSSNFTSHSRTEFAFGHMIQGLTYVVKKEDFKKHKDFLFSILSKH